jgi:hypothetical protein
MWISEVKTGMKVSIPGFITYHNVDVENCHRGGIILLVKHRLTPFILNVDVTAPSQIWIRFSFCKDLLLGGCYIPPVDSDYSDPAIIGQLQAKLRNPDGLLPILLGDINARMWDVDVLSSMWPEGDGLYQGLEDETINPQGRMIVQLCKDTQCAILNHLTHGDRSYGGGRTFKKRDWVSEIDVCIASRKIIPLINEMKIEKQIALPSDHAPLEVTINLSKCTPSLSRTLERTESLGAHYTPVQQTGRRGPPLHRVDEEAFRTHMRNRQPPVIASPEEDLDLLAELLNEAIIVAARASKKRDVIQGPRWDRQQERWTRIIQSGDARTIWRSIGWNGVFREDSNEKPSDEAFKMHFESLLNPCTPALAPLDSSSCPYVPLLDDPFTPAEVENAIKATKNKAFLGACPGLFHWLPQQWLLFLTQMYNAIFSTASYPEPWTRSLLILLFKSGEKDQCGNYRGISIMDSAAKVYDHLLNRRLTQWMSIDAAQAGSQKGRECLEQIITLRILIDTAKRQKKKLFLLFVDFQKAFEKVPRRKLFECLKERGCGGVMLRALEALYRDTKFCLSSAVDIDSSIGVRQGAPTSCLLFVIYIDQLSKMLRTLEDDDFLHHLHAMLLMDDTVLVATSRERLNEKLHTLEAFCNQYGMQMNQKKTKLMVINGKEEDRQSIPSCGANIHHTAHYVYLGAHFSDDGRMTTVMKHEMDASRKHVNKFAAFIHKNYNMPFDFKYKVLTAALSASMLYSCESWLTDNIAGVNKLYMSAMKILLGVRVTTPHLLCQIEIGISDLKSTIMKRQGVFMRRFRLKSAGDEPLAQVLNLTRRTVAAGMVQRLDDAAAADGDLQS